MYQQLAGPLRTDEEQYRDLRAAAGDPLNGEATMEPAVDHSSIRAVWAAALFVSALQRCEQPSTGQVRQAVAVAVREFGRHGCAERMAQEFGDHPETAVTRMRWARGLAAAAIGGRRPEAACSRSPARRAGTRVPCAA